MKLRFSTKLMFASLMLLTLGRVLRVTSEILAYQDFMYSARSWLPVSAVTELAAVTIFAVNLLATFISKAPSRQRQARFSGIERVLLACQHLLRLNSVIVEAVT